MLRAYRELPRVVHLLCLGTFINRAGTVVVPFLALYLKDELGLGVAFATTAMGLFGLGAIGGASIGGYLADHIGRRRVMLIALLGSAAIVLAYGTLRNPGALLAATLALTLVADMYRPAVSAAIADVVEPWRRPQAYGLMYLSINLGFAFGPVIGGLLAKYSYHSLFYYDALTTGVYALLICAWVPETMPARTGTTQPRDAGANARAAEESLEPGGAGRNESRAALADMLHNKPFVRLCMANLLISILYVQTISTFPLYVESLGMGREMYGRLIALNGLLIAVFQIPFASLMARVDRGLALTISALLTAVGFGLKGVAHTPWQFAGTVFLWTLGELMLSPLLPALVADLSPPALRARYMGALSISHSGAHLIGAPLGGVALSTLGRGMWPVGALLATAAAGLLLSLRRQVRRKNSS